MKGWVLLLASVLLVGCGGEATAPGHSSSPAAVASPSPSPATQTFTGTGSKVLSHVQLAAVDYKVTWTATGHDNFIVIVHGQSDTTLVNEIPPEPASGEAFFPSGGGDFTVEVKASTLTWTLVFSPA